MYVMIKSRGGSSAPALHSLSQAQGTGCNFEVLLAHLWRLSPFSLARTRGNRCFSAPEPARELEHHCVKL